MLLPGWANAFKLQAHFTQRLNDIGLGQVLVCGWVVSQAQKQLRHQHRDAGVEGVREGDAECLVREEGVGGNGHLALWEFGKAAVRE